MMLAVAALDEAVNAVDTWPVSDLFPVQAPALVLNIQHVATRWLVAHRPVVALRARRRRLLLCQHDEAGRYRLVAERDR